MAKKRILVVDDEPDLVKAVQQSRLDLCKPIMKW